MRSAWIRLSLSLSLSLEVFGNYLPSKLYPVYEGIRTKKIAGVFVI